MKKSSCTGERHSLHYIAPNLSFVLVILLGPLLRNVQTLLCSSRIPWYQLDLEVTGDRNQRGLELVVINVVGVWRLTFACDDLIRSQDADQSRVQQALGDELATAGASTSSKRKMANAEGRRLLHKGLAGSDGLKPTLRVKLAAIGAKMVHICE